ncbi:MAG: class I SAM-dependent methyltransferase [Pseudomonadota bacterium]
MGGTIKLIIFNVGLLVTGRLLDHSYVHDDSFDRQYGVDTSGVVELDEMTNPAGSLKGATPYEALDPQWFDFLISRAAIGNIDEFQLIDIGSGKGRVLMAAALAGFPDVIGVEIDEGLHRVASRNMEIFQEHTPDVRFTLYHADLREFAFPLGSIVCFANNPVHQPIFQEFVTKIEEALFAHPRKFIFVYLHALHVEAFANAHWVELDAGLVDGSDRHPYAIYDWMG